MNKILARFCDRLEKCRHHISGSDSFFYIYEELQHVVTPSTITDIISPILQHQQLEDTVAIITNDGIRILCILAILDQIDQLTNFLAHSTLDSRLPIREEVELQAIAPDLKPAFFTKYQWQFFPWVFQKNYGHLVLHNRTVLPFTSDEIIAEGSGGVVSAVEIPTQQQAFVNNNDDKVKVVRKRIKGLKSRERTEGLFREEVNCLELYRRLRHANIIPLLGSFTLNQEHNLIFPWYSKNLDKFLSQERAGQFMKNSTFSSALVGLASALQCVHETNWRCRVKPNFYTKYGYHHDFRPANILVTESTFILADFGLAKFSPAPLATEWNENIGHYIAPECMDKSFNPLQVGYSYDIWAFGCFLTEIATFMALGPVGVRNFETQRKSDKYYEKKYQNSYFFDGQSSSLKNQVRDWLLNLSNQTQDRVVVCLASLAGKMLQFSPKDRLDMDIHLIRLYFIHAKCLFYSSTDSLLQTLSQVSQMQYAGSNRASAELNLELSRLKAFGDFLHMNDATKVDCLLFKDAGFRNLVIDCLSRISTAHSFSKVDLIKFTHECVSAESESGVVTAFVPSKLLEESVQDDIRQLCRALPDQQLVDSLFCERVFEGPLTDKELRMIEEWGEDEPERYADVGLQAKLRRLDKALLQGVQTEEGDGYQLILNWKNLLGEQHTFGSYHNIGTYMCDGPDNVKGVRQVLIEWIFVTQFPQSEPEDKRVARLMQLARLLQLSNKSGFCTLDCIGFLPPRPETPYGSGYGFVYPFPSHRDTSVSMNPKSLADLLKNPKYPLALNDKFNIAKKLVRHHYQLQKQKWLHKSFRSENIIFYGYDIRKDERRGLEYLITDGPYVVGFHHGRPDSDIFYSDVPSSGADMDALLYQHPGYKPGENRFLKAYDCYSLAIVLIELAYWSPAKELRSKRSEEGPLIPVPLLETFDKKYSRSLSQSMGKAYMEATRACLYEPDTPESDTASASAFYWSVVQKLKKCYVG